MPGWPEIVTPKARACAFVDGAIAYELTYAVDEYILTGDVTSEVITRVSWSLSSQGIAIGAPALQTAPPITGER